MSASIVRRHYLDVECVIPTVDVVFDADIWKLDVALVVARQVVLPRPFLDLQRIAVRPTVTVVAITIPFLQELLIFALQIVLKHDAVNVRAVVTQAFGFFGVGAIEMRVVFEFSGLLDTVVERLPVARVPVHSARLEQVTSPSSR
jgi:hypothetical protein